MAHTARCSHARCLVTGQQRLLCVYFGGSPVAGLTALNTGRRQDMDEFEAFFKTPTGHDCGQDIWRGRAGVIAATQAAPAATATTRPSLLRAIDLGYVIARDRGSIRAWLCPPLRPAFEVFSAPRQNGLIRSVWPQLTAQPGCTTASRASLRTPKAGKESTMTSTLANRILTVLAKPCWQADPPGSGVIAEELNERRRDVMAALKALEADGRIADVGGGNPHVARGGWALTSPTATLPSPDRA
jgi:hypothetical protein